MVAQGKVPLRQRIRNNLISRAGLVGKLARPVAPMANAALRYAPARYLAEKALGIARQAPFPSISRNRFTDWFFSRECSSAASSKKVVYFHGCSTQYFEPHIGAAAVQVLEANGFEVIVPRQNCCGLPLLSNGEFAAARRYHLNNVRSLVEFAHQGIPIVGTSTSCTLTIKEEAPELLDLHDEDVQLVAAQTFDLNEFLVGLYELGDLNLDLSPLNLNLPYHIACQYRAHRLGRPGTEVLSLIPGLSVQESHADCCGIAGTYGYKVEKYEIAMQVGAPLFDFVRNFGAPLVLCDSETCRWQIAHATGIPAVHPVELLSAAYGFPPQGELENYFHSSK
jgi:glycerol-3-phosphate dehydrogenase subunit C